MNRGECPVPREDSTERVSLALGEGGRLARRWIERSLVPLFPAVGNRLAHDAAILSSESSSLQFSTDSFVVYPRFFPGG